MDPDEAEIYGRVLATLTEIAEAARSRWGPEAACQCGGCLDRRERAARYVASRAMARRAEETA